MKLLRVLVVLAFTVIFFSAFQQKPEFDLKSSITRGQEVYKTYCVTCHSDAGEGEDGVYPPLAKSDYLMADKKRSISVTLKGLSGEIKVGSDTYNSDMPGFDLTDQEASDVLNYIRNSFGNKAAATDVVKPEDVKAMRN